jgi:hypothetical protein
VITRDRYAEAQAGLPKPETADDGFSGLIIHFGPQDVHIAEAAVRHRR